MIINIPISEKEKEHPTVKKCLDSIIGKIEIVSSPEFDEPTHREAVAKNRLKIITKAVKNKDEFVCMQDSRVEHLKPDTLHDCIKYLEENKGCGSVHINVNLNKRMGHAPHMDLAFFVARTKLLKDWKYDIKDGCNCKSLNAHIRKQNFTVDILERQPGRLIKHSKPKD